MIAGDAGMQWGWYEEFHLGHMKFEVHLGIQVEMSSQQLDLQVFLKWLVLMSS